MGSMSEIPAVTQPIRAHYTWEDIKKHVTPGDTWIVINDQVYDVSNWMKKHPGGSKIIRHYAGQDATDAFKAFHLDLPKAERYMKALHRGSLHDPQWVNTHYKQSSMNEDFAELRQTANKMGLFKPSVCFYILSALHVIFLDIMAYLIISYFGIGWIPWIGSVLVAGATQVQAGFLHHDFGHLAVFPSSKLNHLAQIYTMNICKGLSRDWWRHMHNQHHAKPNVLFKDPDVRQEPIFILGAERAQQMGQKEKKKGLYKWQHWYFTLLFGPGLVLFFSVSTWRHAIVRRKWLDIVTMMICIAKHGLLYGPFLGFWGTVAYYYASRLVESQWFGWVTQSSHIPMEIAEDKERPWFSLQLHGTCDIEKSAFNDWFTGHLNFQIEHHLFPTMPRHNLYKIAPLVKSMCDKYNIPHVVKPLLVGFTDIVKTMKRTGEIWHNPSSHQQ